MSLLKDKVAVVTGASRGIGKSIAHCFAREGAHVVICGRKQETLEDVAREIGPQVKPVASHVGRIEHLQRLVESTISEFGRIDVLVNNAATTHCSGFLPGNGRRPVRQNRTAPTGLSLSTIPRANALTVAAMTSIRSWHKLFPARLADSLNLVNAALMGNSDTPDCLLSAGVGHEYHARRRGNLQYGLCSG